MGDVDEEFDRIIDAEAEHTSLRLLEAHAQRVREWADQLRAEGGAPTMHALMHRIIEERAPWPIIITAYSAALWKESGEHSR